MNENLDQVQNHPNLNSCQPQWVNTIVYFYWGGTSPIVISSDSSMVPPQFSSGFINPRGFLVATSCPARSQWCKCPRSWGAGHRNKYDWWVRTRRFIGTCLRFGGFLKMGYPKWSKWMVYKGKFHEHRWFGGTPILGNPYFEIRLIGGYSTTFWTIFWRFLIRGKWLEFGKLLENHGNMILKDTAMFFFDWENGTAK